MRMVVRSEAIPFSARHWEVEGEEVEEVKEVAEE